MPTALQHVFTVPGTVLPLRIGTRELQEVATKFWGVKGESRITGGTGGRFVEIPVLVYGAQFANQGQLASWFDQLGQYQGQTGTLVITSAVNRPALQDCSFDMAALLTDPKIDEAGMLGGGAFAEISFLFRQHS